MPPKVKIDEKKNDKIPLSKISMDRDAKIDGNSETMFQNYGFFLLVSGPVASGKSTIVMSQLTKNHGLFYRKYEYVVVFSPSIHSLPFELKCECYDKFDMETLQEIIDDQTEKTKKGDDSQMLIILDDCLSELIKNGQSSTFNNLILNRSHSKISVIITTQAFTKVPLHLRKSASHVIQCFTQNKRELSAIHTDIVNYPEKVWDKIVKYIFSDRYNFMLIKSTGEIFKNWNKLDIQVDD